MTSGRSETGIVKFLLMLIGGSHIAWLILIMVFGKEFLAESYAGMSAPLWVGVYSLSRIHALYRSHPELLTSFMTKAFFAKMVFYGLLIVTVVRFSTFNTVAFISIFTGFFIVLLGVEAAYLKTLFRNR